MDDLVKCECGAEMKLGEVGDHDCPRLRRLTPEIEAAQIVAVDALIEETFEETAWVLAAYASGNPPYQYSKAHLLGRDGKILCGTKQGLHYSHNNSGDCKRCWMIAPERL